MKITKPSFVGSGLSLLTLAVVFPPSVASQSRLPDMPGHDRYVAMAPQMREAFVSGALRVEWADDGTSFEYEQDGLDWTGQHNSPPFRCTYMLAPRPSAEPQASLG